MIRLVIIFVLGLIIIPHIQSEIYLSARDNIDDPATTVTGMSPGFDTSIDSGNSPFTIPEITTQFKDLTTAEFTSTITNPGPLSSQGVSDLIDSTKFTPTETSQKTNNPSITTTPIVTSTPRPFNPLFRCDFSNSSCFQGSELIITDGSQFNPETLTSASEPPRGPTSDVTSINNVASNNEPCKLPYKPQLDNSNSTTTWDMYFCYNKTCPTQNAPSAMCAPGLYGLISLNSSETTKTIIDSLDPNVMMRDAVGEQCLRFYYYFTVYDDQLDWGQQMQVWIRPNNETVDQFLIGNLTVNDMKENKWNFRDITFNSTFANYTLAFDFAVTAENRTTDPLLNKPIYFALDNIELYDQNCSYVFDQLTTTTVATPPATTPTATATTPTEGAPNPTTQPPSSNLGLVLGLSLGLGIPALLIIIGGAIFYKKRYRESRDGSFDIPMSSQGSRTNSDPYSTSNVF